MIVIPDLIRDPLSLHVSAVQEGRPRLKHVLSDAAGGAEGAG
jgi:hypothetical protein